MVLARLESRAAIHSSLASTYSGRAMLASPSPGVEKTLLQRRIARRTNFISLEPIAAWMALPDQCAVCYPLWRRDCETLVSIHIP